MKRSIPIDGKDRDDEHDGRVGHRGLDLAPQGLTSSSKFSATETRTWSRNPPTSPALTMLIMSGGNTVGCFASAGESDAARLDVAAHLR